MVSGFGAGVAGDKAGMGKVSYNRLGVEFLHERATDGGGTPLSPRCGKGASGTLVSPCRGIWLVCMTKLNGGDDKV